MRHWCNLAAKESGPECTWVNNDDVTVLVSGKGRCCWVSMCTLAITFKMTEWVEQWIHIKFYIKLQHYSAEIIWLIQKAAAMGNWWSAASSRQHACSCITSCAEFFVKLQVTQVTHPLYSPDLVPCDFWLFLKLKWPLKGKRFQTINVIQENTMGQLMATGRLMGDSMVWGPKVPTLKGIEASYSYVQCFFCILHLLQ